MAKHSQVGASSAYRWWECPGSVAMCAKAGPSTTSKYAAEGTLGHSFAEKILKGEMTIPEFETWEGEIEEVEDHKIKITESLIEAVVMYVITIWDDMKEMGLTDKDLRVERSFALLDIDKDAYGTNDADIYDPFKKVIVYDLKTGSGDVVEIKNNKQFKYYALGATAGRDFKEVEMVVVQPRAIHPDGPVRRHTITKAELDEWALELEVRIIETRDPKAPLSAGRWCKWCGGKATVENKSLMLCPEMNKTVTEVAQSEFSPVTLPKAGALTPSQIRHVLEFSDMLKDWISTVQEHAHAYVEQGGSIEGFKLVKKRSNRRWTDADTAEEYFADILGERAYKKTFMTLPQIEKITGKDAVKDYTVKPDAGTTLVSEDDSRQEVEGGPQSDFKAL